MTKIDTKFGFTDEELKEIEYYFNKGKLERIPKEALTALGIYYAQMVEESVQDIDDIETVNNIGISHGVGIDTLTHGLCHMYEDGDMSNELAHLVGDILLDKLIEKAEQGYFSHANRSIDGYWQSVKDNPDAWQGLKSVLEKHPNYTFGQKYLGYMKGDVPEDATVLAQSHLENPDMFFVINSMVDIDGTLIQNGKVNEKLIQKLMGQEEAIGGIAIYTGGNPVSQKKVLLKAIAEKILDKYHLVKKYFSADTILDIYSQDNEKNEALRDKLYEVMRTSTRELCKAKFNLHTEQDWDALKQNNREFKRFIWRTTREIKQILEFLSRLMSTSDDQIKIYPKQAFTQDNICLASTVVDDTQPSAQGIKSLSLAVLNPGESSFWKTDAVYTGGKNLNIPQERQVTAEQVFAMYQQKCKEKIIAVTEQFNKLDTAEKKATVLSESFNNGVENTTR